MITWNGNEPDPLPGWWETKEALIVVALFAAWALVQGI